MYSRGRGSRKHQSDLRLDPALVEFRGIIHEARRDPWHTRATSLAVYIDTLIQRTVVLTSIPSMIMRHDGDTQNDNYIFIHTERSSSRLEELVWARDIGMQTFAAPPQVRLSENSDPGKGFLGC